MSVLEAAAPPVFERKLQTGGIRDLFR